MCAVYKPDDWPDDFDFETDKTCQNVFKPFIEQELNALKTYDNERPDGITYIFHEHAKRVAQDVRNTCLHMGLDKHVANNMYWATLPHDIGKKNLPIHLWDQEEKPDDAIKKYRRTHTLLGAHIVLEVLTEHDHPFKDLMVDIMENHHEQMNGQGTHSKSAEELSCAVRLASIVEAFDGWQIWRPHYIDRDTSVPGVLERMRQEKGADMFDMGLFEPFADMKLAEYNKTPNIKGSKHG